MSEPVLATFDESRLAQAGPRTISDLLEQGRIVYFPRCPVPLPQEADLRLMRDELPSQISRKNLSYHPEVDSVRGLDAKHALYPSTHRVLTQLRRDIAAWAQRAMPDLMRGADIGTCSFRPVEEAGRDIDAHKASELIHIDAGAYGATHGNRILRFLINVHPTRDRVWATKGSFVDVFARHSQRAGFTGPGGRVGRLDESTVDQAWTGLTKGLSSVMPVAKLLDSSPYDRAMKRFHDYLKDTPSFQTETEGHEEICFAPGSAWMVFADGVSHGCLSGQHCFIWTALTPLANSHYPELAPINVLRAAA